jgi:hypothetical protein
MSKWTGIASSQFSLLPSDSIVWFSMSVVVPLAVNDMLTIDVQSSDNGVL